MTAGRRHDAIVIGAGPNGLVAANMLADAGWDVLVLEAQSTPGGAVRSDRELDPDFVTAAWRKLLVNALADLMVLTGRRSGMFRRDDVAALAVHVMVNTALTGATFDVDGGQQFVAA